MRAIAGLKVMALTMGLALVATAPADLAMAGDSVALPAPVAMDPSPPDGPVFAIPTTPDAIGRVMAPVYVNGRGPFRFVVDTGANRSVLSPHLAATLGVDSPTATRQLVHGVTGAEAAPIVPVSEVRFGGLKRSNVALPVLSNRIHANADGMLGADHMRGARLTIDFGRDRIDLSPSNGRRMTDFMVLPARMHFGQLPLITARLGTVEIKGVIDTGAERSIGNTALRRMLEQDSALRGEGMTLVYGAVGPNVQAEIVLAPRLQLAGVRIDRLPILFADTHFFELWNLESEPALLIGMDVLGQLDTLVIDYRRREVAFRFPSDHPVARFTKNGTRL